jgi:hypothetical protein
VLATAIDGRASKTRTSAFARHSTGALAWRLLNQGVGMRRAAVGGTAPNRTLNDGRRLLTERPGWSGPGLTDILIYPEIVESVI